MTQQSNDANSWKSLIAWMKQTKDEEDTDIYAFLEECLGVNASGERSYVDDDIRCVACDEKVCAYYEEPPHKNNRDDAFCYECIKEHYGEDSEQAKRYGYQSK